MATAEQKHAEYLRNRDAYLARQLVYRAANPEKIRVYEASRYTPERKAATIERTKRRRALFGRNREVEAKYRENHKAERAAYNRKYFKEHPDVSRQNNHRRRAQKYLAPFEQFKSAEIYVRDKWICGICGEGVNKDLRHPDPFSPSLDHVIPLARGGHHLRSNSQLAHLCCNKRKNSLLK